MRGFLLLFRRDLVQRWMLFVASFAMGLFIAAIPLLKGSRLSPAELRGAAGLTAALIWCAVLAILLGGSIFTRDLAENRLAFDFRLPVRPGAIWAARLLAAIATIALAAGLLLAPSALFGMDFTGAAAGLDVLLGIGDGGQGVPSHTGLTLAPLAILALLLLANPMALAARARQAWAGVDMISFALVGLAAYWSWQTLRPWEAHSAIWWATAVLIATTLLGTAVASLLQLTRGRTETGKAQSHLSLGVLTAALLAAGVTTGYSQWLTHPSPNDLIGNEAKAQSLGPDWVVLQGPTRSHQQLVARFLVAPASGRTLRLGPLPGDPGARKSVAASIDDSTIAWLESDSKSGALQFFRLSIGAEAPAPLPTPASTTDLCVNWVLSPDGALVAALEMLGKETDPMRLVVSRLATGDVVAAVQFPHCRVFGDMLFASDKEVLIPCGTPSYSDSGSETTRLVRVNLESKTASDEPYQPQFPPGLDVAIGLIQAPRGWWSVATTSVAAPQTIFNLVDPEQKRAPVSLTPPAELRSWAGVRGRQLLDGTLLLLVIEGPYAGRLAVYSDKGDHLRTISLPLPPSSVIAESADSKTLLLSSYRPIAGRGHGGLSFLSVDITAGTSRSLGDGLHFASWLGEIGSTHSVLYNSTGRLLWFNPHTKALQPLLGEAQYFDQAVPTGGSS